MPWSFCALYSISSESYPRFVFYWVLLGLIAANSSHTIERYDCINANEATLTNRGNPLNVGNITTRQIKLFPRFIPFTLPEFGHVLEKKNQ